MKELPSINAVAKLADVSIATVSRVLNNSKPVNADTRRRVEAAVAQLGYRTNAAGRSLAMAQSHLLMVLVPDFANPFYAQIVQGVESVTRQAGYKIVLTDASGGESPHGTALDALYNRLADGVINLAHLDDDAAIVSEVQQLPWVNCSEFLPDSGVPYVSIDHRQAAIDAVQYLLNRGHRRIALISADETYRWARLRHEGYELAMLRAGLAPDPALVRTASSTDYEAGSQAVGGLMALLEPPTAVFAVSDTLAIGAIKALRRAGRRVPDDVAVMGFDDLPLSAVFEPGLTTIGQPMRELGATAAEILLARLRDERLPSRTLAHQLVVRDSA
ncbi:LacI family DNA-binding transcriptional regulator [Ideonella sp. DXS22W]|uniref:LacI family DNA-binding transcriptional regulator n=1 Tax=Pseudaquabacterium inlustre TaxID=2984192 RepID=A0ABU9CLR1_9BURK